MNPGIVGALALIGTAGAIYFGSAYLNDYFAARNADTVIETAAQTEDASDAPSDLVGDAAQAPAEDAGSQEVTTDTMADTAADLAETATEEVAALADGVADAAADMAETVQGSVQEIAGEQEIAGDADQETDRQTLERVLEEAPGNETDIADQENTPEPGTTPVLDIVRIEPTGEAVIAGNAPQGERVGLFYNNELIADADVDAGGDFVLVPDQPIPSGEGTMEIAVLDDAGNMATPSQEQVAVVLPEDGSSDGFLVGILRPNEPVDIVEREAPEVASEARDVETPDVEVAARIEPSETVELTETAETTEAPELEIAARVEPTQAVDAAEATAPEAFVVVDAIELEGREMWIAGGALPGTVIRLYQDNIFLGEVITGEEGRYLYEGTLLESEGEVTVRADALVTGSADVVARAEVPFEVPLSSAQIAAAALEQVEETATEVAEATQEQVANAADAASDVTDAVADTATQTVDAVTEGVAAAVETASDVATEASEQLASALDSVAQTTTTTEDQNATEEMPPADMAETTETPQVEVATTITPNTPPTEALNEALAEAAAETAAPSQDAVSQDAVSEDAVSEDAGSDASVSATAAQADVTPAPPVTAPPVTASAETPAAAPANEVAATQAPAPAASLPAEQPERVSVLDTGQVIIRRGDNLWRLSRRVYGQGIRYTSIYDANRDQIGQPELIFPGQVFTLPTPQEEWGAVPGLEALEADQIPGDGAATQ